MTIGELAFAVRASDRRRTVGITVDRDGSLLLHAPAGCDPDTLARWAHSKRGWVYRKLAEKDLLLAPPQTKTFVTGEGFDYLGRRYRLLLTDDEPDAPVKLEHGRLRMPRSATANTGAVVDAEAGETTNLAKAADPAAPTHPTNVTDSSGPVENDANSPPADLERGRLRMTRGATATARLADKSGYPTDGAEATDPTDAVNSTGSADATDAVRQGSSDPAAMVIHWYRRRGLAWLPPRIQPWSARMDLTPVALDVRDLGYRWGSLGRGGMLNIHWATMQLPVSLIDYVIVHELAHIREPSHTPAFWQTVERAMPDWEARKARLATTGATLWLG